MRVTYQKLVICVKTFAVVMLLTHIYSVIAFTFSVCISQFYWFFDILPSFVQVTSTSAARREILFHLKREQSRGHPRSKIMSIFFFFLFEFGSPTAALSITRTNKWSVLNVYIVHPREQTRFLAYLCFSSRKRNRFSKLICWRIAKAYAFKVKMFDSISVRTWTLFCKWVYNFLSWYNGDILQLLLYLFVEKKKKN